jgi:hypothetical protein
VIKRQTIAMLPYQPGNLSGHRSHINSGGTHPKNRCDQFFISKRARASFAQLLARATVFREIFDGPGHRAAGVSVRSKGAVRGG